eukprot:8482605-Lingulodinium_polyedra.AAC.1
MEHSTLSDERKERLLGGTRGSYNLPEVEVQLLKLFPNEHVDRERQPAWKPRTAPSSSATQSSTTGTSATGST